MDAVRKDKAYVSGTEQIFVRVNERADASAYDVCKLKMIVHMRTALKRGPAAVVSAVGIVQASSFVKRFCGFHNTDPIR